MVGLDLESRDIEDVTVSFIVAAGEVDTKFMLRADLCSHFETVL